MPYCKSGKHCWTNPICAERCCNDKFKQVIIRKENFQKLVSAAIIERDGVIDLKMDGMIYVWVKIENLERLEKSR